MRWLLFILILLPVLSFGQRAVLRTDLQKCTHNGAPVEFGGIAVPGCVTYTDILGNMRYGRDTSFLDGNQFIRLVTAVEEPSLILYSDTTNFSGLVPISQNFANTNLTAIGNRIHTWDNFDLSIIDINQLVLTATNIGLNALNSLVFNAGNITIVNAPTLNNSTNDFLVRNSVTGDIELRNASSIIGGNFANTNLIADANRLHNWGGFDLFVTNIDKLSLSAAEIDINSAFTFAINAGDIALVTVPTLDNTQDDLLVRNSITGNIERRSVSSIAGVDYEDYELFSFDNGNALVGATEFDLTVFSIPAMSVDEIRKRLRVLRNGVVMELVADVGVVASGQLTRVYSTGPTKIFIHTSAPIDDWDEIEVYFKE